MKGQQTMKNRMLSVTIFIAVPVFLALLALNMRNRDAMRRELLQNYQTEVTAEAAKVDVLLRMLEESLVSFPLNNSDIRTVADAKAKDNDFWLANQRLFNQINSMGNTSAVDFTAFLYFPDQDIFYQYQVEEELTSYIKSHIGDLAGESPGYWKSVKLQEEYFVRVLDYNQYYIGMWISFGSLFQFLNVNDGDEIRYQFEPAKEEQKGTGEDHLVKAEEGSCYQVWAAIECTSFSLVQYLDKDMIDRALPGLTDGFLLIFAVMLLIFAVYLWCIYRWLISPMEKMRESMEIIEAGDVNYRIPRPKNSSLELVSVTEQFNAMMDRLDRLQYEIYKDKLERQEVKLQYLSQQIQPHFILNTLNTLYNYSERDIETVRDMIRLVSGYYRYVVNVNSRYVQLGQELEHIGNYLKLQKIRYPRAFDYQILCDEALEIVPVPPFLVESFISNAIKYGRMSGELVHLRIQVDEIRKFHIRIRISDTGEGFSEDMLDILAEYMETGDSSELGGTGIRNSIERLRLIYGSRASIHFYNQEPHGAVVEIQIIINGPEND